MSVFYVWDDLGGKPDMAAPGVFDSLVDAAGGKPLPGRWGLLQASIGAVAQPRHNVSPWLHWPKVALNVAGVVRAYRQASDPTRAEQRKDPVDEWFKARDMTIPRGLERLSSMLLTYSSSIPREDVKPGDGKGAEWIRLHRLPSGIEYAFKMWTGTGYYAGEIGTGPYVAARDVAAFEAQANTIIWNGAGGGDLQLTVQSSSYGPPAFSLGSLGDPGAHVGNGEQQSVEATIERCAKFRARGFTRNILFYGPPGTGKTTLARLVARGAGSGRTLRVEADALARAGVSAVVGFVRILRPAVVLFDDMDRCMDNVVELLHCFEQGGTLKSSGTMMVGTINVVSQVDPALLRPGRFDEVIEVAEPASEHRRRIVEHYARESGLPLSLVDAIHEGTAGFSPADVREVVQSIAVVGAPHLGAEIARVGRQRLLYAGDACERYATNRNTPSRATSR